MWVPHYFLYMYSWEGNVRGLTAILLKYTTTTMDNGDLEMWLKHTHSSHANKNKTNKKPKPQHTPGEANDFQGKERGREGQLLWRLPTACSSPSCHAVSDKLFPSFCLSCKVLSKLPASLQCSLLPALLHFFSLKLSLVFSWTYLTLTKPKNNYLLLLAYFYPCWNHFRWKAIYCQHLYFQVHAQYCMLFLLKSDPHICSKGCLLYIYHGTSSSL